jgi:hypothetical protein
MNKDDAQRATEMRHGKKLLFAFLTPFPAQNPTLLEIKLHPRPGVPGRYFIFL